MLKMLCLPPFKPQISLIMLLLAPNLTLLEAKQGQICPKSKKYGGQPTHNAYDHRVEREATSLAGHLIWAALNK